ncbi:hypothetical protein TCON_2075 [Astathelohania contejeani]|uniref:Uncharacterized protein n=1 Tax=Astathelohania contejeani TaxID=164912 RepID=A0ABQ7HX71_9MICR|nr:hypothetical protein TCON_2075 [Thelohania contejeani]
MEEITTCFEYCGFKCLCNPNFRLEYFEKMTSTLLPFPTLTIGNVKTFLEHVYGRENLNQLIWFLSSKIINSKRILVWRLLKLKFCSGCNDDEDHVSERISSSKEFIGSLRILSTSPPLIQYFNNRGCELLKIKSKSDNFVATVAYYLYGALSDDEIPLCNNNHKCFCNQSYRWNYFISLLKPFLKENQKLLHCKIEDTIQFIYGEKPVFLTVKYQKYQHYPYAKYQLRILISNIKFRCIQGQCTVSILYDEDKSFMKIEFWDVYGNILPTSWFKLFDDYYKSTVITPIMLLTFVSHYYYFVYMDCEVPMYCCFFKWMISKEQNSNEEYIDSSDYNSRNEETDNDSEEVVLNNSSDETY